MIHLTMIYRYCIHPNGSEIAWTTYAESPTATDAVQAAATTATSEPAATGSSEQASSTEVTGCHMHDTTQFCIVGSEEYEVTTPVDATTAPDSYNGCHAHDETM